MNPTQEKHIRAMYKQYMEIIKPLIAEIEAEYQKFPDAITNEIRAFNDHIARCYKDECNVCLVDEQLKKAESHVTRMILDCYKYLIVFYSDKIKKFERKTKRCDLTAIDNGKFYSEYMILKQEAINKVKNAKKQEQKLDVDTYDNYQDSYNAYVELDDYVMKNITKVHWAKMKFTAKTLLGIILWFLSVFIGSILANNNKTIMTFIISIYNKIIT